MDTGRVDGGTRRSGAGLSRPHALGPAPHYLAVFRIVGTVGLLSFGAGPIFPSIWYDRPWRAYAADLVDAVLYGLVMAGVFGWLWPR